jgi:CBS domain-containing protein
VVDEGRVVGIVGERDLFTAMAGGPEAFRSLRVADVMTREIKALRDQVGLDAAPNAFQESGCKVLPVVDSGGRCLGVLTRSDLMAALAGTIAPPSIGGLATPVGVHLHAVTARGGVGDLALFLSGAMVAALFGVAMLLLRVLALIAQPLVPDVPIYAMIASRDIPATGAYYGFQPWVTLTSLVAIYLIFLLLLRWSPMSGYHAAEHQTVHAIEEGDDLTPESVARMSPVHPRCGTNLVAVLVLFMLIFLASDALGVYQMPVMLASIVVLVVAWRRIGPALQAIFTTRRPSRRQLESGVAAGRALLASYRRSLGRPASSAQRIWNIGFAQVLLGMTAAYGCWQLYLWLGGPVF